MDKIHSTLKIKEVKDIFKEEWVEMLRVVSEGEVVYVEATMELEVILEEMVELMNSSPVGERVDLLTMGQISKINVVLIAMNMVEWSSRFFSDMPLAALSLTCKANSVLKADCC